ncbi:MAG: efflux RND transporter permease subunit [Lentisphaerae bacterium]|nr:efflux RND transporter permease subunit [Lentisphaerota bacterium]
MQQTTGLMRIVRLFLSGPLSVIVIVAGMVAGVIALLATPREEDPQIIVPMADVEVAFPGHSPVETEQLVTRPLERLLWQLDGVEHVYSVSRRDGALVTVRFHVGEDQVRAMVRLRDKIEENRNIVPDGVTGWRVIPVSINDVPIVTLTLSGETYDSIELRRIAEELAARLDATPHISRSDIIGGCKRIIRVEPVIENLRAQQISLPEIARAIQRANVTASIGSSIVEGKEFLLLTAPVPVTSEELGQVVISAREGRHIRVADVAVVTDGAEVPSHYVRHNGAPAVTIAFSKKAGVNAVALSGKIIAEAQAALGDIIPRDVTLTVSRNQGESANTRVSGLIEGMFFAIVTVILLLALTMGWRESLVVGASVPVSFALALMTNYIFGYTLNRVTLFALILSLGLVVDDPITNVDNIQRHLRMGRKKPFEAILDAVREVLPPVILSTVAIIISFTPMFFITGMMGPYMGPMAINVPLAVSFSTLCALTFVPFLALKLLQNKNSKSPTGEVVVTAPWIKKFYAALIRPFLRRRNAWLLILAVLLLMAGSTLLLLFKVPLKMLPFDNRDELQLLVKLPPGSTVENTAELITELEEYLARQNEVLHYQSYIGIPSPIDFNGLVRHYNLRTSSNHGDIRINLVPKSRREISSHDFALRIRTAVTALAERHQAVLNIVEVPPGPPVLATVTAEVYAQPDQSLAELRAGAAELQQRMRQTDPKHFAEIDFFNEQSTARWIFVIDPDKAAVSGISAAEITGCLEAAISGYPVGNMRVADERHPLQIVLRLPFADRNELNRLQELTVKGAAGAVPLAELGKFIPAEAELPIMHKNLRRVEFVTAECVGRAPGEILLETQFKTLQENPLPAGIEVEWAGEGEWEVTLRVFRDLGIAFGVALGGIFLLLIVQTNSVRLSLLLMCAIPLTIIGIAPGFWLLNFFGAKTVGGYASPIFFTATAMIGMIALGGIVIRNSIVLLEFIQESMAAGVPLRQAITEAGAVRFRPIMLTAVTTLMGAWPITLDPIFSGLAWALIFGLLASTLFTILVIPAIYLLITEKNNEVQV